MIKICLYYIVILMYLYEKIPLFGNPDLYLNLYLYLYLNLYLYLYLCIFVLAIQSNQKFWSKKERSSFIDIYIYIYIYICIFILIFKLISILVFIDFVRKHYIPEGAKNNCPAKKKLYVPNFRVQKIRKLKIGDARA